MLTKADPAVGSIPEFAESYILPPTEKTCQLMSQKEVSKELLKGITTSRI